jgi:hypothetical protein
MAKYYVSSGQIKHVINRTTHSSAIIDTLKYYKGKGLMTALKICISESGWTRGQICYDIDFFLKDIT